MIFELLEHAREALSCADARPSATCSVCLCELDEDEDDDGGDDRETDDNDNAWLVTPCEHFLHVDCLAAWYGESPEKGLCVAARLTLAAVDKRPSDAHISKSSARWRASTAPSSSAKSRLCSAVPSVALRWATQFVQN